MLPLDRMKGLDKHDRLSIRGFGRDADASIPGSGDSTDRDADGSDSLALFVFISFLSLAVDLLCTPPFCLI